MEYLEQNEDCIICYSLISNYTELEASELTKRQRIIMEADVENILPSACIRRSVFKTCGYFDTDLPYGEDTEWVRRVVMMDAGRIYTLQEPLYLRRIHGNNLSLAHEYSGTELLRVMTRAKINATMLRSDRSVSVIIPAYNAEKYIGEALDSVYRQNWLGELEIIVVDNGSADRTMQVVEGYQGCILLTEARRGAAAARNKGISAASGRFLFLLDADDVMTDDAAAKLFKPMYGAKYYGAVFGRTEDFISPELSDEEKAKLVPREGAYSGGLAGCSLIRREVFEEVGLFDMTLSSGETVDWMIRLKEKDIPCMYLEDTVQNRRLHMTNTGGLAAEEERRNYAAILRKRMMKR